MVNEDIINKVNQFRDERNWRKFHNEKDLSLSISIEAAELLELFQWKESADVVENNKSRISEELADVLIYSIMLAENMGFNINEIIENKLKLNNEKYPIQNVYGHAKKYNDL